MTSAARKSIDLVEEISSVVSGITGITLGVRQRSMVESRLKRRMLQLDLETDEDYLSHFRSNREAETNALVSLLTTHHTFFFREFSHFEFLQEKALLSLAEEARRRGDKKIRVWSAACSRGQEVYSLAMFLQSHLERLAPDVTYEIVGTDVDKESVDFAKNGVYSRQEIKEIPLTYLGNHWARGTGDIQEFVKAKNSIKQACRFETMNLLEIRDSVLSQPFDIIFCRNVFIYFNPSQIRQITTSLIKKLQPQGFLFVGISESLNGLELPVKTMGPSIYVHAAKKVPDLKVVPSLPATGAPITAKPLKILCVDDSPSILALLKKILTAEFGFSVVTTASSGLEAAEKMKTEKFDLMTLDIHMPGQTGIEYLQKNFRGSHPPVVMISSVSRESADLAMQCLQLGASDYIEKPSLTNLSERAEEIRNKLKTAWRMGTLAKANSLDHSFAKSLKVTRPENQVRIIVAGLADQARLRTLFAEFSGTQPPTIVLFEGTGAALDAFAKDFRSKTGLNLQTSETLATPGTSQVVFGEFVKEFDRLQGAFKDRKTSILVFGHPSQQVARKLESWNKAQILIENPEFKVRSTDIVPVTSFAYMSLEFLETTSG